MPTSPIAQLLVLFVLVGAGFAIWKGGPAERAAGLIVLANMLVGIAGDFLVPQGQSYVMLANDGLTALAILVITVRHAAPWMGAVMLFYAAQFTLHSYYLVMGGATKGNLHAIINNINFSGIVWCLIIGTALAWRSRVRARSVAD
jgi:hypothetical protein